MEFLFLGRLYCKINLKESIQKLFSSKAFSVLELQYLLASDQSQMTGLTEARILDYCFNMQFRELPLW